MFKYAQLQNNIVVSIYENTEIQSGENLIDITSIGQKVDLQYTYDPSTKTFNKPEVEEQPTLPEQPTAEDRIAALEKKIEENNLVQVEALTAIYEELQSLKKTAE